jgi:3-phenylpropionate/trans-cinnamate dioxygenase ferredoxin subunit
MAEWVKVAQVSEVAPGQKKPIDLDGIAVLLFNVGGQYYAIEDVCTHDGAPLSGGRFNGTYIACPRHGARFDVCTGKALTMPAVSQWRPIRLRSRATISSWKWTCKRLACLVPGRMRRTQRCLGKKLSMRY